MHVLYPIMYIYIYIYEYHLTIIAATLTTELRDIIKYLFIYLIVSYDAEADLSIYCDVYGAVRSVLPALHIISPFSIALARFIGFCCVAAMESRRRLLLFICLFLSYFANEIYF